MRIPTLALAVLSLVLCASTASLRQPPDNGALLTTRVPADSLVRRQISIGSPDPPSDTACTSTCTPVNNEISLGCPVTACCTTTFETQYYNCLVCIGKALDAGNYTTLQTSLNLLYTTCVDMGYVLQRMELPGQTNGTSTSGQAAATGGSGSTGAAISSRWHSAEMQVLTIGAAVLVGVIGLW